MLFLELSQDKFLSLMHYYASPDNIKSYKEKDYGNILNDDEDKFLNVTYN